MREFLEYHSNTSAFEAPVAAVFSMFYSVNDLWEPVRDILYPSRRLPKPSKRPKKSELSKQLFDTFSNPSRMKAFIAAAPENVRSVWNALVWGNTMPLEALEEELGFKITQINENRKDIWRPALLRSREFPFVVLIDTRGFYHSYDNDAPRRDIAAALPPKIRDAFRKHMSKPKGYDIEPVADAPEAEFSLRFDATAPDDLRFLVEYIDTGNLKLTKSKKIRMTCLREIASMMGGGEFFDAPEISAILPMLRTRLLVMFLHGPGNQGAKHILNPVPEKPGKAFRALLASAFLDPQWIHENLLDHLSGRGRSHYEKQQLEDLFTLFANLDVDGWTTEKNLMSYADYRELDFNIFQYGNVWANAIRPDEEDKEDWGFSNPERVYLHKFSRDFHTIPLVHGMAFLLAALGFAEIRYNHPATATKWIRTREDFLSPFGGLVAIRLTPLGAFAFAKSDQLEIDDSARKGVHIVLNEHRLTLTCRDLDRTTELLLNDYTEKISDGCHRMTRKSLMRGCKTAEDVAKRTERFKKRIPAEIPPLWERFFSETAKNCVALRKRSGYVFHELSDTPELRRLFLSDPLLRKKSIKTAGPGVAIKRKDIPEVSRRLAALGYLMQ